MSQSFSLKNYLKEKQDWVNEALEKALPEPNIWPQPLHEAMIYSLLAGGKRLRPILALASAECLGAPASQALDVAVALEMIHTYSLIHDDLPAMDNDDLRRGKPTNHKTFGEGLAILAGDSLLTEAFRVLSCSHFPKNPEARLKIIQQVALASGSLGMAGGQAIDLLSEGKKISLDELQKIHAHKTGKLILVSVQAGALVAEANQADYENLSRFAELIGLSFQIADDILDIEGSQEIGKDIGSDLEKGKATYPTLMGLKASKDKAQALTQEALNCLNVYGENAQALAAITSYVVQRKK